MRNERDAIEQCLAGFQAQTYPLDLLDVIVVDGGSDDGSRQIVERWAATHPWVRVVDNPAVRAILVNVHGGGMQPCDTIAEGIGIAARRRASEQPAREVPIVISLAGNHADFARTVLANTGVAYIACGTPWEAALKAVACAKAESPSWLSSLVARRA